MKDNFKNVSYNALGFIFPVIVGLFTTPYIVHKLGSELYGVYILCISVIGFLSFFDLGFGSGIIKFISKYEARRDFERINKIVNTALVLNTLMGLVGTFCILFLNDFLIYLLNVKIENQYITKFAFKITSIGFLITLLTGVFSSIPKGLQRYDVATKIQICVWIGSLLSTVLILYFGFSLKEVLLSWVIFQALGLFTYYYASKQLLVNLYINFSFHTEIFKEIFKFSLFIALNNITGNIVYRVDKIIIGVLLGPSFITYYQISFMIVEIVNRFIGSLLQVLFPAVSYIQSLGDIEKLRYIFITTSRYVIAFALIAFTILSLYGEKFLIIWMGEDFAEKSKNIIPILSFIFLFHSIASIGINFYNGMGYSIMNMISSLFGSISYLAVSFLLIKSFSLTGAAIAFGFTLVPIPYFLGKLIKLLNIPFTWLIKLFIKVCVIILLTLLFKHSIKFKIENIYILILHALLCSGLVFCLIHGFRILDFKEVIYVVKKNSKNLDN